MARWVATTALVVAMVMAGLTIPSAAPVGAETLGLDLTMVPDSGTWVVKSGAGSSLPDPTTLTGSIDSETGQFDGATLSIPSWQEENQGSLQEFTIAEVTPGSVSGRIDFDANVSIDAALSVTVHILTPLDFTCVTEPVNVSLESVAPYDTGTQQVTVSATNFSIPAFPTTEGCPSVVTGPLNDGYAGSVGNAMILTLAGDLPVPPPPGETTETALTADPAGGSLSGQPVDLTAAVSSGGSPAGDATGNVEFFDGAVSLGTAPVSGGEATVTTSALAVGERSLTARYSGDGAYEPSASAPLTYLVDAVATVTADIPPFLTIDAEPVEFNATLTNPPGGAELSNIRLDLQFTLSDAFTPSAAVTLEYQDGTGVWQPVELTTNGVDRTGSFGAATGFPLPAGTELMVPFRIGVAEAGNLGTITAMTHLNSVAPDSGDVLVTLSSATAVITVVRDARVATTTTISTESFSVIQGFRISANYLIEPSFPLPQPAGVRDLLVDGEVVATQAAVTASGGFFDVPTADWLIGTHSLTVRFRGDAWHVGSVAEPITVTINPRIGTLYECARSGGSDGIIAVDIALLQGDLPGVALAGTEVTAADVTLRVGIGRAVSDGPVENIALEFAPAGSGTAPDAMAGSESISISGASATIPVGGNPGDIVDVELASLHFRTVRFFGLLITDYDCTPFAEPARLGSIAVAGTTLSVDPPSPAVAGQPVTFTASVAPSTSVGNVVFYDADDAVGVAAVSDGVATLTTSELSVGAHTLGARFTGDLVTPPNDSESVPYEVVEVVEPAPDAAIRAATSGAPFMEFGFVSDTPTKEQTVKDTAPARVSKSFRFKVENLGDEPGTFTLTGTGAQNGFRVKYYDQAGNKINSAVLGAGLEMTVDPGELSEVFKVRVKPSGQAPLNAKVKPIMTFTAEDGSSDVLRVNLKRV